MIADRPLPSARGGITVPGNRWDLIVPTPDPTTTVTVVVPWFDDQARLDLVLAGLAAQTHPADRMQVVVADDGSPHPPVVPAGTIVVRQERRGFRAAAARNLGAAAADGDVICFLDADTVPEPGYVAAAIARPARCEDVLVVGRRRHADLTGWDGADVRAWFAGGHPAPPELAEPTWLIDAYRNSADLLHADDRTYRFMISAVLTGSRGLFDEIGGFDETFDAYGGEDWDFAHRAWTAGAVLAHEPRAVAWHDGPEWASRLDAAAAKTQKNAELRSLACRIPDPALRGPGPFTDAPVAVVVVPSDADERLDAWWLSARAWLAAEPDLTVAAGPSLVAASADPRVVATETAARALRRARVRIDVGRPYLPGRAFVSELLGRLAAPGPGRIDATDGSLTAWSQRARNRSHRHGVGVDDLFDTATIAPPEVVGDDPPNLGRWLPRLPLP